MLHKLSLYYLFLLATIQFCFGQSKIDSIKQIDSIEINYNNKTIIQSNKLDLNVERIENSPKFLGLSDPIKFLQQMPGFGNGGDTNAGLIFRGLSNSEIGYFYNNIPIQNPQHLFGLFPVFNTNAISQISYHSNNAPGIFNGKISGYLEINSDWNIQDTTILKSELSLFHFGIGTRIERQGNKMIEVYWRNTFLNKTLWPILNELQHTEDKVNYDLYDFYTNIKKKIKSNEIKVTFYRGRDIANFGLYEGNVKNKINWGNIISGINHNLDINPKVRLENNLNLSIYDAYIDLNILDENFLLKMNQSSYNLNSTLHYNPSKYNIETGVLISKENIKNKIISTTDDNLLNSAQNSAKVFLKFQSPLFSNFSYQLNNSILYQNNLKTKFRYMPELTLNYSPNNKHTFNAVYNIRYQNILHLPITNINLPADYSLLSNTDFPPAKMNEISMAYRYNVKNFELAFDTYLRNVNNLVEFNGKIIELSKTKDLSNSIIEGNGQSYGADLFSAYRSKRFSTTIKYSYARSFRKFDKINNGYWYPYIYDRPHNLVLSGNYKINNKLSFSSIFYFQSGNTFTPVLGLYYFNDSIIGEYGNKNSMRTESYHRLDLSMDYTLPSTQKLTQKLNFSIMNIYNRKNPIFKYLTYERNQFEIDNSLKFLQKSGPSLPILPSISYFLVIK